MKIFYNKYVKQMIHKYTHLFTRIKEKSTITDTKMYTQYTHNEHRVKAVLQ